MSLEVGPPFTQKKAASSRARVGRCSGRFDLIERVYFPTAGLISLVVSAGKGELTEAGMVGREAQSVCKVLLCPRTSYTRAIVQVAGTSYTIAADIMREAIHRREEVRDYNGQRLQFVGRVRDWIANCTVVDDRQKSLAH